MLIISIFSYLCLHQESSLVQVNWSVVGWKNIVFERLLGLVHCLNVSLSCSVFGIGSMAYMGLEMAAFFEIPWNSPCYQVMRGINPILQMIFTFSQLYFVFMNARVSTVPGQLEHLGTYPVMQNSQLQTT
jgi:hypothetical protein